MDSKSLLDHLFRLKESFRKYLETKISYYGFTAFEKAVRVLSLLLSNIVVILVFFLAFIFLSGAASIYLGRLTGHFELGLLIVGGFYFLIGLILFGFRKKIFSPIVIKALYRVFFNEEDE